jgi:hypothetical protein
MRPATVVFSPRIAPQLAPTEAQNPPDGSFRSVYEAASCGWLTP